jgi:DNA polymerase-1
VLYSNANEAQDLINRTIKRYIKDLEADRLKIAFSGPNNFRKQLYPEYKGNRKNQRKPLCYGYLKQLMFIDYPCYQEDTLEADDLLGIWATDPREDVRSIIVSDDKDLRTIPGFHYSSDKLTWVDKHEATFNLYKQTLTGDTTDGYKGVPGIGPVKAERMLLKDCSWATVVKAYEDIGMTKEDAILNYRMARILHSTDWNRTKKEVIFWEPK